MSKKPASKGAPNKPAPAAKRSSPFLPIALAVVVLGAGVYFWSSRTDPAAAPEPAAAAAAPAEEAKSPAVSNVASTPEAEAAAARLAAMGPHQQATLPAIPFRGYAPPRPPEVIAAAYQFAAEHPEVLAYVPCYCGCGASAGHRGNSDCFVRSRAANGDVMEYDEHGVDCTVCIDVATRSRQMHAAGASVTDIRAAMDREYSSFASSSTATPKPPAR